MVVSIRSMHKSRARIRSLGVSSIRVRRSNKQFYVDIVSPEGISLAGVSTLTPDVAKKLKSGGNKEAASELAGHTKELLKKLSIDKVAFDRSGYIYHGRVKAFAEALRSAGIIN